MPNETTVAKNAATETIADPERRGWRMWIPSSIMMTCSLLSYIDRQTLSVLAPMIIDQTNLTDASYGDAVTFFSIAYMIGNPLWGSLLDYLGLRIGMFLAVLVWTGASGMHAFVFGFMGFAAARTMLGFGEGATFPGAMKTATMSLPPARRGRGIGLAYSGASLGGLFTPIVVTPFAIAYGWQTAFIVTALLGLIWLTVWWNIARPPLIVAHERPSSGPRFPNLMERRAWVVISSFGFGGVALAVVAYLLPLILNRSLGISQAELGNIVWIPYLGWEAGYFFWGWVADKFVDFGSGKRPTWVFALMAILALPSMLVPLTTSVWVVLALMTWATFVADGFVVLSLRVGSHIYPPDRVGLAGGIGSAAWSGVVAIVSPIYTRLGEAGEFTMIFVSMALLPTIGLLLWLVLSRPDYLWHRAAENEPVPTA